MSNTRRPPTGADVARAAGVSRATVSYAMNDVPHSRIPEETRRRVRGIAAELGYQPRSDARSLRRGRTDLVVVPTYIVPFGQLIQRFMDQLARALHDMGHTLVLHGNPDAHGIEAARAWVALNPAAVLVMPERMTAEAVEFLTTHGVAVVAFGSSPSPVALTLKADHAGAGALAARHLVERGRRDLATVMPREPGLADMGRARVEGFRAEAERGGAAVRVVEMAESPAAAAEVARAWHTGARPDGLYGYNDEYAALLMGAMSDIGIAVPADVAVVGTDNLSLCEMVRPRLTTVAFEEQVRARDVATAIIAAIEGTESPDLLVWQMSLAQRDST